MWDQPRAAPEEPGRLEWILVLLVAILAFLLASFPARNSDLWMHLANGRLLVQGEASLATGPRHPSGFQISHSWLFYLLCYALYSAFAGPGLVLGKALLVVGLALLLLHLSRSDRRGLSPPSLHWWLPTFCTALALLAISTRLLLQPATISCLFLALTLWFLRDRSSPDTPKEPASARRDWLPPWPLVALFVVWVNMDSWFVLGLGTVALVGLGRALDSTSRGRFSLLVSLPLLALVCLLNPAHIHAFALPPELGLFPYLDYLVNRRLSAAGLAYIPLLILGLLSFVLNLPRWHWQRFLPWLGLAFLSAFQVRAVPFFAVVAGPILAWNLLEFIAEGFDTRQQQSQVWHRSIRSGRVSTALFVLVLLVCAWPGWLQGKPFEPRRWAVEPSPSLEKGAATTRRWLQEGKLGPDPRGLHLSAETAHTFAWFCPEEKGLLDDRLAAAIRGDLEALSTTLGDWDEQMRGAGINHVILYDTDSGRLCTTMDRLLEDPQQWPLLYVEGDLAVFGWRDPAAPGASDPFRGRQLDLNHLAFHPPEDKKAPGTRSDREPEPRQWWDAFWKPVRPRPVDQEEATLHLFHAEALRWSAPRRHLAAWEASQSAALVGASATWAGRGALGAGFPTPLFDARMRLTLLRPLTPEWGSRLNTLPGPDQLAHALQQQFTLRRDDTSPALLYLTVRAARRAVAVNPDDAQAYLVLGESYLRLVRSTRERAWGKQLPEIVQLRRAQASAALNQAISLKPDFAQAHLSLSTLYREMDYLDLALEHLRTYVKQIHEAGPPPEVSSEQFREQEASLEVELNQLAKDVQKRDDKYELESAGWKVRDRAFKAWQVGLAGKARDLLLESDVAAFGPKGMALELELLLRTGRAKDVREWTGPEQQAALGPSYHWLRAQALAASGDYDLAQKECAELSKSVGAQGQEPAHLRGVMALMIGQRVLDEQPEGRTSPDLLRRAAGRFELRNRIGGLAQSLRRWADVTVLRGLILLEKGDVDEAEIAFKEALTLWGDEAAAASGAGLDFSARPIAQGCLHWLE